MRMSPVDSASLGASDDGIMMIVALAGPRTRQLREWGVYRSAARHKQPNLRSQIKLGFPSRGRAMRLSLAQSGRPRPGPASIASRGRPWPQLPVASWQVAGSSPGAGQEPYEPASVRH